MLNRIFFKCKDLIVKDMPLTTMHKIKWFSLLSFFIISAFFIKSKSWKVSLIDVRKVYSSLTMKEIDRTPKRIRIKLIILRFLSTILAFIWFSLEVMEDFLLSNIVSSSSLDSALTNIGVWCEEEKFEFCSITFTFGNNLASSMIRTKPDTKSHQLDRLFKWYQSGTDAAAVVGMEQESFLICLSCFQT